MPRQATWPRCTFVSTSPQFGGALQKAHAVRAPADCGQHAKGPPVLALRWPGALAGRSFLSVRAGRWRPTNGPAAKQS